MSFDIRIVNGFVTPGHPAGRHSTRRWRALGAAGAAVLLCAITSPFWLPAVGNWLVLSGGDADLSSARADVIGIPDSAWIASPIAADRVMLTSEWIARGRARLAVMTCGTDYGVSGCELAQRNLAAQGRPALPLAEVRLPSSPAEVEAAALLAEVSRLGAGSVIVLVDPLTSRRLNRVYRREGGKRGIAVTVVYMPVPGFRASNWWRTREGRKAGVFELCQWAGIP